MKRGDIVRLNHQPNDRWVVLGVASEFGRIPYSILEFTHEDDDETDIPFDPGMVFVMVLDRRGYDVGYIDVMRPRNMELVVDDPRYGPA